MKNALPPEVLSAVLTARRKPKLTPPLKWHGGKHYLADWILSHAPPRVKCSNNPAADDPGYLHYVEPFAGGLAVLLANDPNGISEVVNDLDEGIANFWRVLAVDDSFAEFRRGVECLPFCEQRWREAVAEVALFGSVGRAIAFFVRCRQSMSGRMKEFAPLSRSRCRGGMNEQVSAWLTAVDGLPAVHERLRRVVVLNRPAIDVIKSADSPRTWFYLDPPYLHETRATVGEYAHEMTIRDHSLLLQALASVKGRFALSGYRSDLYDGEADALGWRRVEKRIANQSAKAKTKRMMTECLWLNY